MKFVVFGEALIDLIRAPEESGATSLWRAHCGGGPMNTAAALARLGQEVQLVTRLGEDAMGQQLARHIESSGVGLELATRTTDPTTLAVVSLDEAGKASYSFHTLGTTNFNWQNAEFPRVDPDAWLHFGSIGAVLEPTFDLVRDFLAGTSNRKSFDLNVRPSVLPDRKQYESKIRQLLEIVGRSGGFAKASDEDLGWLCAGQEDPIELARNWVAEYGLQFFLVTLGPAGAVAVDGSTEICRVPGKRITLVDTVGAGDTFNAGFLASFSEENLEHALIQGVGASALVCERSGAQPPTAEELAAFLAQR